MIITPNSAEIIPVVTSADNITGAVQGGWTYPHYLSLPEDGNRYEIIEGVLYLMPSPTPKHQKVIGKLQYWLYQAVELKGLGEVYTAPLNVILSFQDVVQPDIMIILKSNAGIITTRNIEGSPDLVIEVTSPSTVGYDRDEKKRAYAKAGVKEYWLVDPATETIEVLVLETGNYKSAGAYRGAVTLPTKVIPKFKANVEVFFG